MAHKLKRLTVLVILAAPYGMADAGPPIPSHMIEGNSGVLITSTAYFTNSGRAGGNLRLAECLGDCFVSR